MEWLVSHLVDLRIDTVLEVLVAMVHLTKRKALGIAEAITTRLLCRSGPPCRRTSNVQLGRCSMFPHSSHPHCSSFTPIEWAVCRNPSTASSFPLAKSERPFWTCGRWSQGHPRHKTDPYQGNSPRLVVVPIVTMVLLEPAGVVQ